jgi:hypothetical protein
MQTFSGVLVSVDGLEVLSAPNETSENDRNVDR